MEKNRTTNGTPILTDKGRDSFLSFVELSTISILEKGFRVMFFSALSDLLYEETWFDEFLDEIKTLHQFFDEIKDEYGPD